ncbi:MAG: hypothetical protein ABL867_10595 [Rickettsiales bacterium]
MELSIVIVIIGLVVGGALVGRDLIKAAELRAIISEKETYTTAVNSFRLKYSAMPGDMANAADIWGIGAGNSSDNYTDSCSTSIFFTPPTGTQTCNGDGNSLIGGKGASAFFQLIVDKEPLSVASHLANAGLIQGKYIPAYSPYIPGGGTTRGPIVMAVVNVPSSKNDSHAAWYISYICINDTFFDKSCKHRILLGRESSVRYTGWQDMPLYPVLTSVEAKAVDIKIDDGLPGKGSITSLPDNNFFTPDCATTTNANTAIYDLSSTDVTCSLIFNAGF